MVIKQQVRRAAATTLKAAAAAADLVRRPHPGVVVLLYHQVGGPRASEVNLSAPRFAEQLDHLLAQGGVETLDDAIDELTVARSTASSADDRHVLTFDDGTADFVDVALPLLVDRRLPVTLYVATRWVEEGRSFWDDGTVLSWTALADAVATGLVTIGSHTHNHVLLDRLDGAAVADELDRSIDLIGDRLGVRAEHFAYPKALAPSAEAESAVRARFRSAALAGTRVNVPGATDLYRLWRTPVQVGDGMRWFKRKAAGGLRVEDQVRELVNRRRYAGAAH